ncbi:MAG: hypothetical protein ACLSE8_09010 [Parasutterella sp.]
MNRIKRKIKSFGRCWDTGGLETAESKIDLHIKEIDEFLSQHKDRLKIRSAVKKTEKENE